MPFADELGSLPRPSTSNPLNNPSHTGVHTEIADAIEALQEKVGIDDSDGVNLKGRELIRAGAVGFWRRSGFPSFYSTSPL